MLQFFQKLEIQLGTNIRSHLKNSSLLTLSSFTITVFGFLMSYIYANFLPKDVFGEYRYLLGISNLFNGFALTGINAAVTRAVSIGKDAALISTTREQLRWGFLHSVIGISLSTIFFLTDKLSTGLALLLISFIAPISNALNTAFAFLQGKKAYKALGFITVLQSFSIYLGVALGIYYKLSVLWLLFFNLFLTFLATAFTYYWTIKKYSPPTTHDTESFTHGIQLSLAGLIRTIFDQIDVFIIHSLLSPVEVAQFAIATSIPDRLKGQWKIIQSISLPLHSTRPIQEIVKALTKKMLLLLFTAAIFSFILAISIPKLFYYFYNPYSELAFITQIYSFSIVGGASIIPYTVMIAQKNNKGIFITTLMSGCFYLIILFFLILHHGIYGAIIAKMLFSYLELLVSWLALKLSVSDYFTTSDIVT